MQTLMFIDILEIDEVRWEKGLINEDSALFVGLYY